MISTNINFDGDEFFKNFDKSKIVEAKGLHTITVFEGGMQSGKPSVAFVSEMEDGTMVYSETSMNIFLTAARAYEARFGPPSNAIGDVVGSGPKPGIGPDAGIGKTGGGHGG
jgi:hypothetical protein